ncbi:MAG TPA: metallophosphoesterase [Chitinophagaceae bacterium]|nr:metallophosphoesterase [Chitinophagaceae bacterium]
MLLLDFYVFQALKVVTQGAAPKARNIIVFVYWTLSVLALLTFVLLPFLNLDNHAKGIRTTVFAVVVGLFFAKFTIAVFMLVDDLRRFLQWIAAKLFFSNTEGEGSQDDNGISRSVFLNWLGIAAGGGIYASLLHGFSNKYNYEIRTIPLQFSNLPQSFKGLRVVQISDVHSGSFTNKKAVQHGIQKILDLKPDLILFTGDLVNNKSDEMEFYMDVFKQLAAPMGVYSILGNHDYGDYVDWGSAAEKKKNLDRLKGVHAALGWKLLLNEHVVFEKGGEKIALLGVENWSAKARFPKYGKLQDAYTGSENIPFKILMSHDPSHWDAEVRTQYSDIDLMLAGHTHGMQFGVELPWFKWSPVQYVYRQWAGLYEADAQKLYVNRGYGFIGYPGRVGILPEITVLELA